ncbi:inositol monophosphatase family protein [Pseudonocardia abyssalis]|uniref:Inositol monophosphatase family protein n=1 Tax=Pseudonocardia abyssalis TaxID=2792008 RepID=A0ABS6UKX8_9PSEU|nr:inositol monophosphatase family protein [Pseudonocardia abyssalis]MBW0116501.1 inositol monophosphatase family protein [Pseudonocardia abyssalis]MBW0132827.1 inositol monophosphatase family protein [Pseudonocardia abyssalis]
MPTVSELLPIAVEAVDRATLMVRERQPGKVTIKGDRDPATEVDYAIERELRAFLLDVAPDVGFLGEEDGRFGDSESGFMWALDPIDGTVNFMQGVPLYGVSLGLVHQERPVLGVIDLPFLGIRYSALRGGGAFRGDTPIRARGERLAESIVAIGDYAVGNGATLKNAERLDITGRLAAVAQRVRMFGSAAVDLAWVAEGRIGASVMLANKPWDTVAGVLLAREAGAEVLDRHGEPHTLRSDSTVAVAPALRADLMRILAV